VGNGVEPRGSWCRFAAPREVKSTTAARTIVLDIEDAPNTILDMMAVFLGAIYLLTT
jgi:hypothetical protein